MDSIGITIYQGIKELWSNPLRSFLSILGISIGVFCIVSVSTVFDSMESNIQNNMASLGSNVLYVGKFAWLPEEQDEKYAWWRYKDRPVVTSDELAVIQKEARLSSYSALSYTTSTSAKFMNATIDATRLYAVTHDFNKLQPIDLKMGRYFSLREMQNGVFNGVVIGETLAENLFGGIHPIDKEIILNNKPFYVLGVVKKTGQMTTGFQFDEGAIISYNYFQNFTNINKNTNNGFADPLLMISTRKSGNFEEMKYEVEGILRRLRGIKATEENNFSFNQLDGIQDKVKEIFSKVRTVGWLIGGFSLIVGIFSVANIMFVSVKERTNIIGIKKAIGAPSRVVLIEFLIEAILLCIAGGFFGLVLTSILTSIMTYFFEFPIFIDIHNILFGLVISILVGVLAGFIPAYRASKLDPAVAIRS